MDEQEKIQNENTETESKKSSLKERALYALAYLPIGFINLTFCTLFFIPLLFAENKEKAKGYANEGLVISIFRIVCDLLWNTLRVFVNVNGTAANIVNISINVVFLFFIVFGMINALNGKQIKILGHLSIID